MDRIVKTEQPSQTDDILLTYKRLIANIKPLPKAEEDSLIKDYKTTGSVRARNRVIESHLKMVITIASKFTGYKMNFGDLVAEGNVALIEAMDAYDMDRKNKFSTYAWYGVWESMQKYVKSNWSLVHNKKGMKEKDLSLDIPVLDDGNRTNDMSHIDLVECESDSPEESYQSKQMFDIGRPALLEACKMLTEKQLHVFTARRLHDPKATLQGLANDMGVTKEAIRQIENRALEVVVSHISKRLGVK